MGKNKLPTEPIVYCTSDGTSLVGPFLQGLLAGISFNLLIPFLLFVSPQYAGFSCMAMEEIPSTLLFFP